MCPDSTPDEKQSQVTADGLQETADMLSDWAVQKRIPGTLGAPIVFGAALALRQAASALEARDQLLSRVAALVPKWRNEYVEAGARFGDCRAECAMQVDDILVAAELRGAEDARGARVAELEAEVASLRTRLAKAEETIAAAGIFPPAAEEE